MRAIRELSMNERECWETGPQGRLEIRQDVQKPLVDEIFVQMDWIENHGGLTPSNEVLKAIKYMTSRKAVFTRFLDDPNLRIENNTSEHAVRKFVLGRKNWMFFGSEKGAESGCIIMSLTQTCRNMGINPEDYFTDILQQLIAIDEKDLKTLLPDVWLKNKISTPKIDQEK